MTVGYSLCCTPFLLPPPFRPPLRRPTFLSSSLARAALLSVPLFPSISGKRTREREREREREYNGGTFVGRTDLSRCRAEPHYRLPVNSNRVIEQANFSWTSSVFLEIGRGLVNLAHHLSLLFEFIVFAIATVVSCSLRSPSAISFCFCSSRETGPIVNYRGTISFVLLSNRIELPACRSYLLIHNLYSIQYSRFRIPIIIVRRNESKKLSILHESSLVKI